VGTPVVDGLLRRRRDPFPGDGGPGRSGG